MKTDEYIEISVLCSIEVADIVGSIFMENGCKSVAADVDVNNPAILTGKMLVKSYLEDTEDTVKVIELIHNALRRFQDQSEIRDIYSVGSLEVRKESSEDWMNKWKEFWKPSKVSECFVVVPSWEVYAPQVGEKIIHLDPGIAFGTGSHATTMLCIQELEKYVKPGDKVLDLGCGSGILAIAASKLGADKVLGIDIDPFAIEASLENAEKNNLKNVCMFSSTLLQDLQEQYDVVVANLISHTILELLADIIRVTYSEGLLILSGIVKEKEFLIADQLRKNSVDVLFSKVMGDWCVITGRKILQ